MDIYTVHSLVLRPLFYRFLFVVEKRKKAVWERDMISINHITQILIYNHKFSDLTVTACTGRLCSPGYVIIANNKIQQQKSSAQLEAR